MANYSVQLSTKAKKYLDKLSDSIAQPIFDAISSLETDPRPGGCIKLKS
jgi:mRNA-degrading endonuclease RelE of RelBE toxin-antitoxin system